MSLLRLGCKKTVFSVFTALWLSLSLSFRSPAAKVDLKGVLPTQSQSILGLEGSVLELMLYSDHLEKYWIIFELGICICILHWASHISCSCQQPYRDRYSGKPKPASKHE